MPAAALNPLFSVQVWKLALSLGVLAMLLEWLRVDPTFGTSVSVWLFFPLLAVAWRGLWAGALTAVVASVPMLFFSRALFLPFDALVFVGTTVLVGWCCARGQTARVIDGILMSWVISIPASVVFHLSTYQQEMSAGILITTTMMLSQLVPAMLVQWLAFTRSPLWALQKLFGPRRVGRPVHLLVVVRAAVIPMILLPLLVTQYFSTTQWLLGRAELEERRAVLFGEALVTALEGSLGSVTADIKGSPDGNLQVQIRDLLNQSRAEAPSGAMRFDVELVASTGETGRALPYFVTDTAFKPRSPIDWLMHREVVFDVPLAAAAISGQQLRLAIPLSRQSVDKEQFKIWGLLSALIFLVLLEALYRLALLRLIGSFENFGQQIAAWVPGQPLEVVSETSRGRILQVDQYVDGVTGLVSDFNENYRVLSEANAERRKLLARVSAILRSVAQPIIVTDANLLPLPNFCNESGRRWSRHLEGSLKLAAARLVDRGKAVQSSSDPFADIFVAAIRGDQGVMDSNLTLNDWEGVPHEFGLSLGVIGAQPGQRVDVHGSHNVEGFVILLTDISVLLNQQWETGRRSRLESLENVASGVAHEINQPLNIIRMASSNLLQKIEGGTLDPAALRSKLERIDEQVGRMASLITTMRSFSSSESKAVRETDPNELIQNLVTLLSGSLRSANVELTLDLSKGAGVVMANSNSLGHVFTEIIQNAIEVLEQLPAGRPRWIGISSEIRDGRWLAVVEDDGGGIPANIMDRIFEPFFTTKQQAVHSGFGLHEAFRIVKGLGGTLEASNAEEGARFVIALPLLPGS